MIIGNLHLNVSCPHFSDDIKSRLEPYVYEWVANHHGSISAEHGLGLLKNDYIYYSRSKESVALMQSIKTMLDPHGILNPYKTLPSFSSK